MKLLIPTPQHPPRTEGWHEFDRLKRLLKCQAQQQRDKELRIKAAEILRRP